MNTFFFLKKCIVQSILLIDKKQFSVVFKIQHVGMPAKVAPNVRAYWGGQQLALHVNS